MALLLKQVGNRYPTSRYLAVFSVERVAAAPNAFLTYYFSAWFAIHLYFTDNFVLVNVRGMCDSTILLSSHY